MSDDVPATPRRRFLTRLSVGLGAIAAAAAGIPVLGFLFAPAARRPDDQWQVLGAVDAFKVGETVEVRFTDPASVPWAGPATQVAAWLQRKTATEFVAYSMNCTHLGCPVRWVAGAKLFLCPCHGGVYYGDGSVAGGPPPRALSQYAVRVERARVLIQTRAPSV